MKYNCHSLIIRSLVVICCVLSFAHHLEARRGGGYRGSSSSRSSRTSSSSRSSSSSSSSTRSSYGGRLTRGSSFYSSYITYVPSVRYSRSYTSAVIGATYWYYYSRYFQYANTYYLYRGNQNYNSDTYVCANYEANSNGTYMGVFVCPLDFEPSSYTSCCGDKYAEFCCEPNNSSTTAIVVALVILLLILVIIFVIYAKRAKIKKAFKGSVIRPPPSQPTPASAYTNAAYEPPPPAYTNAAYQPQQPAKPMPDQYSTDPSLPPPYDSTGYGGYSTMPQQPSYPPMPDHGAPPTSYPPMPDHGAPPTSYPPMPEAPPTSYPPMPPSMSNYPPMPQPGIPSASNHYDPTAPPTQYPGYQPQTNMDSSNTAQMTAGNANTSHHSNTNPENPSLSLDPGNLPTQHNQMQYGVGAGLYSK